MDAFINNIFVYDNLVLESLPFQMFFKFHIFQVVIISPAATRTPPNQIPPYTSLYPASQKGQILGDHQEGDPRYLAPELLTGDFGKPADVFSLGITVLELTGDIDLPRGGDLWHKLRLGTVPCEFNKG